MTATQPDLTESLMAEYWRQVERLIVKAAEADMDLAISTPRMESGGLGRYNMVYEHQLLDKGASPLSRPDQHWHVYRDIRETLRRGGVI